MKSAGVLEVICVVGRIVDAVVERMRMNVEGAIEGTEEGSKTKNLGKVLISITFQVVPHDLWSRKLSVVSRALWENRQIMREL